MIQTPRLKLVPASVELARAEVHNRAQFAVLLNARVPENWPPETAVDALPLFLQWIEESPEHVGWYAWYVLMSSEKSIEPELVAGCGFLGAPKDGEVEMGYSVLPQFYRLGIATEMIAALVKWAFQQPGLSRIIANTDESNVASIRVLEKTGFKKIGPGAEPMTVRFAIESPVG